MILSSSERGRDRAAWGLLVRRAAPRAMTRAGTRHCGAEAGAEAPLTLSGFPPGQCRAAPGSREGGFPPPVLHPLTVPGDPRGQQHEAQRKTKMPELLFKNQGENAAFPPFFLFLTTMSLSTCPLLGTVSLGGENLKTSNRWCQPRPSSFCRGRECGRRRHTCGRRGSCSVAWTRVQVSVVLEKGTAHRATRPDTRTRTLPTADRMGTNGRFSCASVSFCVKMPGWGVTTPASGNQRKLQKRGMTHSCSARRWSAGSRGSARFLAENLCICAHLCVRVSMRVHVYCPVPHYNLSVVLRDCKERSQGNGLASRTRRNGRTLLGGETAPPHFRL